MAEKDWLCIRNRNQVPPGGFYWVAPTGAIIRAGNHDALHHKVPKWYEANGITLPDDIDLQIDQQICERVHAEYCWPCIANNRPLARAGRFARAMYGWLLTGVKVDGKLYQKRLAICSQCEHWQGEAKLGYGECKACGCGKLKLFMVKERCRLNKW